MESSPATYMNEAPKETTFEAPDHIYARDNVQSTVDVETEDMQCSQPIIEAVEIVPLEMAKKTHHTGPIPEGYIIEKRARQETFSKRLQTFVKQAEALHAMCGAEVRAYVVSESGRKVQIEAPAVGRRHVKTQTAGDTGITTRTVLREKTTNITHTPKKTPVKINNLPGKRQKTLSLKVINDRVNNKCATCKVIYNSKADANFRKANGKKSATWIGCDRDGCKYLVHAKCAGIEIINLKSLPSLKFLCPKHK